MNKTETKQLLGMLAAVYRNYFRGDDLDFTVLVWADALIDDEHRHIMSAAKEYIKTDASGFPPSVGQLRILAKEFKRKEREAEKDKLQLKEPDPVPMSESEIEQRIAVWAEAKKILQG